MTAPHFPMTLAERARSIADRTGYVPGYGNHRRVEEYALRMLREAVGDHAAFVALQNEISKQES